MNSFAELLQVLIKNSKMKDVGWKSAMSPLDVTERYTVHL